MMDLPDAMQAVYGLRRELRIDILEARVAALEGMLRPTGAIATDWTLGPPAKRCGKCYWISPGESWAVADGNCPRCGAEEKT